MNAPLDTLRALFPPNMHKSLSLVGGAVRDVLLGRPVADLDVVAAIPAHELKTLGFRLVEGKSTSPIWLRNISGVGNVEITRIDDMSALESDLRRRDFTANAIAISLQGDVYDPLNGRSDLGQRLLRPCSDRTFDNDPIRIFRAFRFAADDWELAPECTTLLRDHLAPGTFERIPVERFTREMLKALGSRAPDRFFLLMLDYDVGESYLPELFHMPEIPAGPPIHHPEGDLFTHAVQVLQRVSTASDDPLIRFCAFFHDLGKLATPPDRYPRHHGHEETGYRTASGFCRRLKLPAGYGRALAWVSRLHGKLHKWHEMRNGTKMRIAEQALRAGIGNLLLLVATADKEMSAPQQEWDRALAIAALSVNDLDIDMAILDGIKPELRGKEILRRKIEVYQANRTYNV